MLIVCGLLNGCGGASPAAHSGAPVLTGSLNGRPIAHVVVLAIDGLEQDALMTYLARTPPKKPGGLHDLLGVQVDSRGLSLTKGIAVRRASTVFPSYTYAAWTSMLTGVFPGAHGITGNSVFFRDRRVARYYTEYHADAAKVQLDEDFLSEDINDKVQTVYEYLGGRGTSIVVHHMVTRGSGKGAVRPNQSTLWSYQRNRAKAVDENTLWEAVKALKDFNEDSGEAGTQPPLRLPSLMTIYFSGMDHAEHLAPQDPEAARLDYMASLDDLIAKFIAGDRSIRRNHYATPLSDPEKNGVMEWRGLLNEPVMQQTLFILVSDHGHTPIAWHKALGIEDLKLIFDELSRKTGRPYQLEIPSLIDGSALSVLRAVFGFLHDGTISGDANIVATLNGGALGLHIRPHDGQWMDTPDYDRDIVPILEHLLLTLEKNDQAPEAVLYKRGQRYLFVPYRYDGSAIRLLPAIGLDRSPLNHSDYPMAERRLNGLAGRSPTDPASAPDIVLLADRSKQLTYLNKRDWRVIEELDVEKHRHFHSDHGHLNASDSLVPMIFVSGRTWKSGSLSTICEASLVDVTPTILDLLGLLPAFQSATQHRPDDMKGQSLKGFLENIAAGAQPAGDGNVCAPVMTVPR